MKTVKWMSVLFWGATAHIGACTPKLPNDCEFLHTCPDASGGASTTGGTSESEGSGGDEGEGGAHSGGTTSTGDGDGDTSSSGGVVVDPCDACEGETPVCVDEECVACSEAERGACSEDEVCSAENECVSCLDNSHCTEPAASVCDLDTNTCTGCEDNESCAHLESLSICNAETSACVQCLTADDCGGKVCDPATCSCTELTAGTEFACEACQYDAQCAPGHVCVEMSYSNPTEGVVGSFCLWQREAALPGPNGSCGLNSQPFAQQATVETVDGAEAIVCRPRTTTCVALLQHSITVAGCAVEFTDDAACGAENFNDGRCRYNPSSEPRCSYPCLGNEDCKAGATCPSAGDQYCSL